PSSAATTRARRGSTREESTCVRDHLPRYEWSGRQEVLYVALQYISEPGGRVLGNRRVIALVATLGLLIAGTRTGALASTVGPPGIAKKAPLGDPALTDETVDLEAKMTDQLWYGQVQGVTFDSPEHLPGHVV